MMGGAWRVVVAVLVLSGLPVFAESTRLYLTARVPLDERGREPISDVVDVGASTAFRVYVVVEAPSPATRDKRLRVTAVNQSPSLADGGRHGLLSSAERGRPRHRDASRIVRDSRARHAMAATRRARRP